MPDHFSIHLREWADTGYWKAIRTMHGRENIDEQEDPTFRARARPTWEVVRRVTPYLRPYWGMAGANIFCVLISLGFSLVFPRLVQAIIDHVVGGLRTGYGLLAAGLVAAFLMRDVFNSLHIIV